MRQLVQSIGRDARNEVENTLRVTPLLRQGRVAGLYQHTEDDLGQWWDDVAALRHDAAVLLLVVPGLRLG